MHRECRERFPRHRFQRKPLVSDPGMNHGARLMHVPWCMSGSLTSGGGENVPGIPGACATRNFAYLVKGPWSFFSTTIRLNRMSPEQNDCHFAVCIFKWLLVFRFNFYLPLRLRANSKKNIILVRLHITVNINWICYSICDFWGLLKS